MEFVIDILIVLGIVVLSLSADKKRKQKAQSSRQPVPNRPRPEQKSGGSVSQRARQAAGEWRKSVYEADRDTHYDRHSLDYCDSDVPSSRGITFRGLPEGTDELAYLARFNRGRERLLEQSLESRE